MQLNRGDQLTVPVVCAKNIFPGLDLFDLWFSRRSYLTNLLVPILKKSYLGGEGEGELT